MAQFSAGLSSCSIGHATNLHRHHRKAQDEAEAIEGPALEDGSFAGVHREHGLGASLGAISS